MSHEVKDFKAEVIERSREIPVLADFWAPWCGPCRALGPLLERMARQANGRWELAKVNTEERPDLAAAYSIASIPAVKLFVNGEVKDEFVGALGEREIRRFLEKALPSPRAGELAEARRLLSEGAAGLAAERLRPIVGAEPGNLEARLLLAEALLGVEPAGIEPLLEPVGANSEFAERASALRTLGRLAALGARPDNLPEDRVRGRYLAGIGALRTGDFGAALEAFIEVVQRNKAYENGGAREACKAIFQLLGMRHPLVDRFFRAFSSALHA